MTIFDNIKYPISFPITTEELNNIPSDIWLGWMWSEQRENLPIKDISELTYILELRKFMANWENDNI